jgi:hypothetical protein
VAGGERGVAAGRGAQASRRGWLWVPGGSLARARRGGASGPCEAAGGHAVPPLGPWKPQGVVGGFWHIHERALDHGGAPAPRFAARGLQKRSRKASNEVYEGMRMIGMAAAAWRAHLAARGPCARHVARTSFTPKLTPAAAGCRRRICGALSLY